MVNFMDKIVIRLLKGEKRINYFRKKGVKIGRNCDIESNVSFGSEPYLIEIGDNVRISAGVKIATHDGGIFVLRNLGYLENADKFGKVTIGNNVNIGIDSLILAGSTIGNNVVIGAGAVVTKNIPDNSVAVGVPARVIESIEEYYDKVKDKCVYTKNLSPKKKREYIENNINN